MLSEPLPQRGVPVEVVRQYFHRLFVERDLSVCDELLAPGYVDHDAPDGTPAGPGATRAYVAQMFDDMPDLTVDLHEVHADAGAVMVRASWRGTRRDGVRFEQAGLALIHVSDTGQLLERWSAYQPSGPRNRSSQ
jgi:ketosteroid isomerase-like protein